MLNLLFAINHGYISMFLDCMRSILKNGGEDRYAVYLLHSDLTDADQAAITDSLGSGADVHFVPVDPALFDGFPESSRYPRQIYYRIAAPLLLPPDLDRVLYLDADLVVINPLRTLYDQPFDGAYYLGCTHIRKFLSKLNQARLGVEQEVPYINTGVLLMNLPALREHLRMEDVRAYANEHKAALLLPDQDILSALFGDRIKLVDPLRYNLSDRILSFHNADPAKTHIDVDWVRANTVIIHYCGKNKPWAEKYHGVLDVFYHELKAAGRE